MFHRSSFVGFPPICAFRDVSRREKVLYVCANYLKEHWSKYNIVPVVLCAEDDVLARLKSNYELSFTVKQYVEGEIFPYVWLSRHLSVVFFSRVCCLF